MAGQKLGVFGQGYMGGTDVQIWLESSPVLLTTVVSAADGTFSTTVLIPVGTAAGAHSIVSMGLGADDASLTLTAPITVTAPTPPPTTTVDSSGSSGTAPMAAMLALLLAITGVAFMSAMYVSRRERR